MDTRGIDKNQLVVAFGFNPEQGVAGSLRLARGDAELLAEQMVEQRRLADIGTADNGDIATAR